MRTLLRHTQTGLFFQGPDNWTQNPALAYDFRFIDRAIEYARTWELSNGELAFAVDDVGSVVTASLESSSVHYAEV